MFVEQNPKLGCQSFCPCFVLLCHDGLVVRWLALWPYSQGSVGCMGSSWAEFVRFPFTFVCFLPKTIRLGQMATLRLCPL